MKYWLAGIFLLFALKNAWAAPNDSIVAYYKGGQVYEKYLPVGNFVDSNFNYTRFAPLGHTIVRGRYTKGERIGLWWFYYKPSPRDTARLREVYDYTERRLIYLDTLKMAGLVNFPGGDEELGIYLNEQFKLAGVPADSLTPWKGKRLVFIFHITAAGPPADIKISLVQNQVSSAYLQNVFLNIIRLCPYWRRPALMVDTGLQLSLPIQF